jgi:hypothetical protein
LSSLQSLGVPAVQVPAWQLSPTVQASPSLHAVPLESAGLEQLPVAESQRSCVQALLSPQFLAAPGVQVPL